MNYEDALKVWGEQKLNEYYKNGPYTSVTVTMEFDEGYACCGGSDPHCYCSFAESPKAYVEIAGTDNKGRRQRREIDSWSFDFASILREIVVAGGGTVTS